MSSSLRSALGFFTIAPVKHRGLDRSNAGAAMLWAPFIGLLVAGGGAFFILVARFMLDPHRKLSLSTTLGKGADAGVITDVGLLPAVFGIAAVALLTRGLHLDGLADTTDGLAAYRDRDTSLSIMRKPDLGPLGMVTVVLFLMADVAALRECINSHRGTTSLIVAVITGRLAMTLACTRATPAARSEGLGAIVAGSVSRGGAAVVALATVALAGLAAIADTHSLGRTSETVHAVVAVVLGCAGAHLFRSHCVRRLGGITGDVLGALSETGTLIALLVMAVGI